MNAKSAQNTSHHNVDPQPSVEVITAVESPGTVLRKAREKAQLNVNDIADKLHLVSSQIVALEEDRYDYFHGEIFCKGYLRAYANLMEIESKGVIESYNKLRPSAPENIEHKVYKTHHIQIPAKGRTIQYWCAAIILAVIALLWAFSGDSSQQALSPSLLHDENLLAVDERDRSLLKTLESPTQLPKNNKAVVDNNARIKAMSNASAAFDVNSVVVDTPVNTVSQNQSLSGGTVGSERKLSEPAVSEPIAPAPQVLATQSNEPVLQGDALRFYFSADCWVKVTDSNNITLVARLKKADDVLTLRGSAPFTIVLGYAPAVSLEYNGEFVAINKTGNGNMAKIVVGQQL